MAEKVRSNHPGGGGSVTPPGAPGESRGAHRPALPSQPLSQAPLSQAPLNTTVRLLLKFQRFGRDVAGVLVVALALMTLLALLFPRLSGGVLRLWAALLRLGLGDGSFFVVMVLGIAGLLLLRRRTAAALRVPWRQVFALEGAAFAALALFALLGGASPERAEQGLDGGVIGWGLAELMRVVLSKIGLGASLWSGMIMGLVTFLGAVYGSGLAGPLSRRLRKALEPAPDQEMAAEPTLSVAPVSEASASLAGGDLKRTQGVPPRRPALPAEFRKKFRVEPPDQKPAVSPSPRDEHLPPLNVLFSDQSNRVDEASINETAGLIEKTLAEFGIPARVVGFKTGPTVTQFAVEPGFVEKTGATEEEVVQQRKVRVAQIAGLHRDLALALSAQRLRIEAPVPGRPYIGIEVPNSRSAVVRLRSILESDQFYKVNSPLAMALGRDVSGQPVVADLERMPHMLIAGTTGSGKSICIAAITLCLVMNNTPADLRLVMIDPKMVELVRFNGLPHLLGKVETEVQRILGVLHWIVAEMDRRYKLLETMHARNIEAYNRKSARRKGAELLPRLVVMIDELADLMTSAPDQTEPALIRLAQMARATGIHLVVATQRPSTDVVTGLIKANFPARLAFQVASSVDSRVILDVTGAEALLGHGDMLFMPPEVSGPVRSQGVMVSDAEVERVISFWQQAHPPEAGRMAPWEQMLSEQQVQADRDDLVDRAIAYVRRTQHASASLLQRQLRIGYPRAARLLDELEELGVVGPGQGGGRERQVLLEREEGDEDA